jgi:hypothetical protein
MITKVLKFFMGLAGFILISQSIRAGEAVDYLNIPGPIQFEDQVFYLAWSASTQGKSIQEYVPKGQSVEHYTEMIIVDLAYNVDLEEAFRGKIQFMEQRKGVDPVAHYQLWKNEKGDLYAIDLLLSEKEITEWDVIRYFAFEQNGRSGCYIYTFSKRAYGDDYRPFLLNLKEKRPKDIEAFGHLVLPDIKK